MNDQILKTLGRILALGTVALLPIVARSQTAPAAKGASPQNQYASRWDIFLGYSYLSPHGTVNTTVRYPPPIRPVTGSYDAVNVGGLGSVAYYFNRHVGFQFEYGIHEWGDSRPGTNIGTHGNDDGFQTVSGGLIGRFPAGNITPFIHALVGGAYVSGPNQQGPKWGPDLTAGGGMDYETPLFNHRLAIRIFQADFEYMHADFGPASQIEGGRANVNAARLSAGFVIHAGSIAPPPPVTYACTASPTAVFQGEPVTINCSAGNLNPKDNVIYTWSGTGVTGNGNTATVATTDLAPGNYSAQSTVKEGKKGKEGLKPWETANASASFTVKEFEPPTISCSVNPTTIQPGGTATITATGVSPQNRPLTYSYSATGGSISGTGATAEYSSAGAPTGAVGITCNVSDDKGHTATANTTVTIEAPPPPPQPHAQALCSMSFATDKRRPTRVDNEAKACLDQVALDLKQQADAKLVIVGESNAQEKQLEQRAAARQQRNRRVHVEHFADQRAVNAKDYLVTQQGIDASRITVTTSTTDGQEAQDYLVPAGANFETDVSGTTPVDESTIKPEARKPLPTRHRGRARTAPAGGH